MLNIFRGCSNLTDFYFYADKSILDKNIFGNFNYAICAITLYVPKADMSYYQSTSPGMLFRKVVGVSAGSTPDVKQCAKPTVCFEDGKIYFDCETTGAEFVSTVATPQTGEMHESVLDLGVAYYITVYAKKPGYKDSETVKAKLLWTGMVLDVEDGEASGLSKRHKADVNSDGDVNISDVVSVINVMAGN